MVGNKGKSDLLAAGLVIAAIVGVLSLTGVINLRSLLTTGGVPTSTTLATAGGVSCPTTLQTTVKGVAKNPLNSSLNYVASPVYYLSADGKVKDSETYTTTDVSPSYSTGKALTCGNAYKVATVNDASFVGVIYDVVSVSEKPDRGTSAISGDTERLDFNVPKSGEIIFALTDSDHNNQTSATIGAEGSGESKWIQDTTSVAQTFGAAAGGSWTGYLQLKINATAAQFGWDLYPPYICVDFDTSVYSKANGVIVSGLTEASLSDPLLSYCSANGYDKAYRLPRAIKSTDGMVEYSISIKNDLGAASNKDVKFIFVDVHNYLKNDGSLAQGTANDNLAAIGETDRYVTWNDN